ncbi:MAG: phosphoribosylformylglycinamidine synthase subunit PurQ [Candidatus Electryonea clarkiae]|nr:phosphoribosylformylglycinamidine synthase subunit PurQ [Candidatus Electryonea clarkiae]MDP8286349.1 phosphoribosylformylglycinamidine synthase subunit PurQ [Candidatus Electryonea clarkiae]
MKWGVVVFPGSNCDHDAYDALSRLLGQEVKYVWHQDRNIADLDAVLLPGGFSYGDYLRAGAIARFSDIMDEVVTFAHEGGTVIGICNGFQVLTEAGLLPGALIRNTSLRFICEDVPIRVEHTDCRFSASCSTGDVLKIPIAHNEGNYVLNDTELEDILAKGQVLFRYCSPGGEINDQNNPNGSLHSIAGVINESGNVLGMMPHPERRCDPILGSTDGRKIFDSVIKWVENNGKR